MAELAIGATSRNLTGLVLQQGVALAGVGVLVGVVAGAAVTRALRASIDSALFRTSPFALVPTLSAAVILVGVTVAATWLPAWRAARTNPLLILRAEE
jgi:ABC-type antimicrobial peptide transport system permease subunit